KLNARLEQLTASLDGRAQGATPAPGAMPSPAPGPASRRAPPLAPEEPGLDQVIAEIAARQRALEEGPLAPAAATSEPRPERQYARQEDTHQETVVAATGPDLSGLEKQLGQIAAQIETLRRP